MVVFGGGKLNHRLSVRTLRRVRDTFQNSARNCWESVGVWRAPAEEEGGVAFGALTTNSSEPSEVKSRRTRRGTAWIGLHAHGMVR